VAEAGARAEAEDLLFPKVVSGANCEKLLSNFYFSLL